jgi:hypothetical protein
MAEIFARTSDHGSTGDLDLLRRPATPMTDAELYSTISNANASFTPASAPPAIIA